MITLRFHNKFQDALWTILFGVIENVLCVKRSELSLIFGIISYGFRNLFEGFKAVVKKLNSSPIKWQDGTLCGAFYDKFSDRSSEFGEGLNVVGDHPSPLEQLTKKTLRVQ